MLKSNFKLLTLTTFILFKWENILIWEKEEKHFWIYNFKIYLLIARGRKTSRILSFPRGCKNSPRDLISRGLFLWSEVSSNWKFLSRVRKPRGVIKNLEGWNSRGSKYEFFLEVFSSRFTISRILILEDIITPSRKVLWFGKNIKMI